MGTVAPAAVGTLHGRCGGISQSALGRTDVGVRALKESDLAIGIMRTQCRENALSDDAPLFLAQSCTHLWPSRPRELLLPRFDQKSMTRLTSGAFLLWMLTIQASAVSGGLSS
jgi:hypothetical protein